MSGMVIAPIRTTKQRRMLRRFREAGATRPESALRPEDLGVRRSWLFERLVGRGVFVLIADGRYFLDEIAAQQWSLARRRNALLALIVVILILLFIMAAGLGRQY